MNTRKIGKSLEQYVAYMLQDIDPKSRPSKNSGADNEIGDVINKFFIIECKKRNTKDITVKKDVWDKLCSIVPIGSQKVPLYVLENNTKDRFVVLDIKDFIRIIKEIYNAEN